MTAAMNDCANNSSYTCSLNSLAIANYQLVLIHSYVQVVNIIVAITLCMIITIVSHNVVATHTTLVKKLKIFIKFLTEHHDHYS